MGSSVKRVSNFSESRTGLRISVSLPCWVLMLYEFLAVAHASSDLTQVQVAGSSLNAYVTGGSINANITNPRELARANRKQLDGMSVYTN